MDKQTDKSMDRETDKNYGWNNRQIDKNVQTNG